MPLRDVAKFVGHDRGQFISCGHDTDQAQVNAQITTWQGEGIDRAVAHQEAFVRKPALGVGVDVALGARGAHQRRPQRLQVVQQQRVVQVGRIAPHLAHDLLADALFLAEVEPAKVLEALT